MHSKQLLELILKNGLVFLPCQFGFNVFCRGLDELVGLIEIKRPMFSFHGGEIYSLEDIYFIVGVSDHYVGGKDFKSRDEYLAYIDKIRRIIKDQFRERLSIWCF